MIRIILLSALIAASGASSLRSGFWNSVYEPEITAAEPCRGGDCKQAIIDMADVATHMRVGGEEGDSPKPDCFKGLFWMQGNPMSDDVASFYGAKFENMCDGDNMRVGDHQCQKGWPKKFTTKATNSSKSGDASHLSGAGTDTMLKYVMQVRVANPEVWTWHNDFKGKTGYRGVGAAGLVYQFECDEKAAQCQIGGTCNIRPRFSTWGLGKLGSLAPMQFWMTMQEDPLAPKTGVIWERRSALFGLSKHRHTYRLRRIVDKNSKPLGGVKPKGVKGGKKGPFQAYLGCVEAGDPKFQKLGEKATCTVDKENDSTPIPPSFMGRNMALSDKDKKAAISEIASGNWDMFGTKEGGVPQVD